VVERLHEIHEVLRTEIAYAQAGYQDNADRRLIAALTYRIGDRVWLDARNIRTRRPYRRLDHRRLGPFAIEKIVSSHAYELDLSRGIDIHPVQPVAFLDPTANDPLPGQRLPPPPPVIVGDEQEWFVEQILDSRVSAASFNILSNGLAMTFRPGNLGGMLTRPLLSTSSTAGTLISLALTPSSLS